MRSSRVSLVEDQCNGENPETYGLDIKNRNCCVRQCDRPANQVNRSDRRALMDPNEEGLKESAMNRSLTNDKHKKKNASATGVWRASAQNNEHDGDTEHEDYVS